MLDAFFSNTETERGCNTNVEKYLAEGFRCVMLLLSRTCWCVVFFFICASPLSKGVLLGLYCVVLCCVVQEEFALCQVALRCVVLC